MSLSSRLSIDSTVSPATRLYTWWEREAEWALWSTIKNEQERFRDVNRSRLHFIVVIGITQLMTFITINYCLRIQHSRRAYSGPNTGLEAMWSQDEQATAPVS